MLSVVKKRDLISLTRIRLNSDTPGRQNKGNIGNVMKETFICLIAIGFVQRQTLFNGLSIHSRANCVNNETISGWDLAIDTLNTQTSYQNGLLIYMNMPLMANRWRSCRVWGEGRGGLHAVGNHYTAYKPGDLIPWFN